MFPNVDTKKFSRVDGEFVVQKRSPADKMMTKGFTRNRRKTPQPPKSSEPVFVFPFLLPEETQTLSSSSAVPKRDRFGYSYTCNGKIPDNKDWVSNGTDEDSWLFMEKIGFLRMFEGMFPQKLEHFLYCHHHSRYNEIVSRITDIYDEYLRLVRTMLDYGDMDASQSLEDRVAPYKEAFVKLKPSLTAFTEHLVAICLADPKLTEIYVEYLKLPHTPWSPPHGGPSHGP